MSQAKSVGIEINPTVDTSKQLPSRVPCYQTPSHLGILSECQRWFESIVPALIVLFPSNRTGFGYFIHRGNRIGPASFLAGTMRTSMLLSNLVLRLFFAVTRASVHRVES